MRCGLESNGAPDFDFNGRLTHPLHGRIQNRPAHKVDVAIDGETGDITITGVVEETRFHITKLRLTTTIRTKVGEPGVRITDVVENFGGVDATAQMLYHINFGQPLVDPGSRFVAPVKTVVPRTDHAATAWARGRVFLTKAPASKSRSICWNCSPATMAKTQVLLKNAHSTHGVTLRFNENKLPCFTLWKDPGRRARMAT